MFPPSAQFPYQKSSDSPKVDELCRFFSVNFYWDRESDIAVNVSGSALFYRWYYSPATLCKTYLTSHYERLE